MNWWLYVLLLSWVTFGIYSIYLYFKRINRIDHFIRRKREYYASVLEFTERYAQETGHYDEVRNQTNDLRDSTNHAFDQNLKPINAALAFILTLLTLGIYGLYVLYRMNRIWNDLTTAL